MIHVTFRQILRISRFFLSVRFITVLNSFRLQMRQLSVVLILQLNFFTTVIVYQSLDLSLLYYQNDTINFRKDEQFRSLTSHKHSNFRRQIPLNTLISAQPRIPLTPSYIILGPRIIRPGQIISISVIILRDEWNPMVIKALISNGDKDVASAEDIIMMNVPHILQMNVPNNIRNGTYRLTIEGKLLTGERKFSNISELIFEQKALSIFIQLDRPIYRQETIIQFRCIPIYPDLRGYFHTVDVYILGPSGHILRKWENQQTTAGMISLEVKKHLLSLFFIVIPLFL